MSELSNFGLQAGSAGEACAIQRLNVLVAGGHHLVREGLKLALQQLEDDVEVLEADTLGQAIAAYEAHPDVDLVLLDLSMPGAPGLAALEGFQHRCPRARVVVISTLYDLQTVQAAVRRGVLGFIPKTAGKQALLNALRFILSGGIYVPPEAMMGEPHERVIGNPPAPAARPATSPLAAGLTSRQIDVLNQLLEGKSNKQICRDMNLALGTVKGHIAAILSALGVTSRAQAMATANKLGWHASLGYNTDSGSF